jgi:hypothetical protein
VFKDAAGNGDVGGDEDQAAEQVTPLADLGAEPVYEPQPDQDRVTLTAPMLIVAANLDRPREMATLRRASTRLRYSALLSRQLSQARTESHSALAIRALRA